MKNFILIILATLSIFQLSAQEYFYYYKGEKKYLELNTDYIFIAADNKASLQNAQLSTLMDIKKSTQIHEDNTAKRLFKPINFVPKNSFKYWKKIKVNKHLSGVSYKSQLQQLRHDNSKLIIAPYLKGKSSDAIGVSNYFKVKLKHQDDFKILLEQIEAHQVELVGYNKFMPLWFTLSVTPNTHDAMQMANIFYETGLFQYAEPSLLVKVRTNSTESQTNIKNIVNIPNFNNNTSPNSPNDEYYDDQWYLKNNDYEGIDINVEPAWNITKGADAVIAIIDDGIQMDHPDLVNNIVGTGYDAFTGTSPSVVRLRHATPCAGIAGAEGNNDEGISGVAPNCGLMSVSNHFFGDEEIISDNLADGINWAWQNGADVLSNSWGGDDLEFQLLDDAIDAALTQGRGGLGCVVVFGSGNDSTDGAQYPANSDHRILCVGGIDRCGIRSKGVGGDIPSCEIWTSGGSNFGDPIDVVAGGTRISTTDNTADQNASTGYNPFWDFDNEYVNKDYTVGFSGTSAACPQVAGVAALVLSVNPNLRGIEVNDIIEQSAQKINSRPDLYTYENNPDRPNGLWNNELGYGLVDAYQAVLLALDCEVDLTLSGTINSNHYEAGISITATGNIGTNQSVTFDAGGHIELNNLFDANSANGSTFSAYIEGCLPDQNAAKTSNDSDDNAGMYVIEKTTSQTSPIDLKNYPNPFTGQTTIAFTLLKDTPITLTVSDATGRELLVLLNDVVKEQGAHSINFDGSNYPAGIYYYTIQAGEYTGVQKMVLIK